VIELGAVFVGGLLGSAHCLGMCGPLAALVSASRQRFRSMVARQTIYSFGRLCTYMFLGAVGGAAGLYLSRFRVSLVGGQQVFSVLAGVMMVCVGLSVWGIWPFRRKAVKAGGAGCATSPLFRAFLTAKGYSGFLSAGIATGFLPCGLVYSFLAMAIASGSVLQGMLIMGSFGLGTVPAMVSIGFGSAWISHRSRLQVFRLAACFVILMGGVSIYRGIPKADGSCCHATSSEPSGDQTSVPR
jgi:hypothetical protein